MTSKRPRELRGHQRSSDLGCSVGRWSEGSGFQLLLTLEHRLEGSEATPRALPLAPLPVPNAKPDRAPATFDLWVSSKEFAVCFRTKRASSSSLWNPLTTPHIFHPTSDSGESG